IEEGDFDDDFDDINDMVDKAMENVEGDIVNAAIGVSATSASVTTAGVSISTAEPKTPPTTTIKAFKDEDLTIAQTFVKMRTRIDADALFATKLQEEERGQFFIDEQARFLVEIIIERKRFFAAQRAKKLRNKPPTKAQLRNKMITYLKNIGSFTYIQLKNKSLEEIQKLYEKEQKWINNFVPIDSEVVKDIGKKDDSSQKQVESTKKRPREEHHEESVKKQKLEDDIEKDKLRACLDIIPGDDFAINVESLPAKYPIVDRKTQILTKNMMYYQIIRANGSSKNYKIFTEMCDDFDRQDVLDLYRLVKQRYETISPEGYDILL
nr:hypothetical protein [Tanacetum cinerariifolium]